MCAVVTGATCEGKPGGSPGCIGPAYLEVIRRDTEPSQYRQSPSGTQSAYRSGLDRLKQQNKRKVDRRQRTRVHVAIASPDRPHRDQLSRRRLSHADREIDEADVFCVCRACPRCLCDTRLVVRPYVPVAAPAAQHAVPGLQHKWLHDSNAVCQAILVVWKRSVSLAETFRTPAQAHATM